MSAAVLVATALGGAACRREAAPATPVAAATPPASSPTQGPTAARAADRARVTLESPSGRSSSVVAEIARTEDEHARGLMWRERLGDGEGMLFVFREEDDHAFWMKNTLIPLDMVFVDSGRRVVGVVANATPGSLEPRSGGRSRYVLEVPGGWAAARGVGAGDRMTIEELRP